MGVDEEMWRLNEKFGS